MNKVKDLLIFTGVIFMNINLLKLQLAFLRNLIHFEPNFVCKPFDTMKLKFNHVYAGHMTKMAAIHV